MKRKAKTDSPVRAWAEELVLPTYLPAAPDRNPMFLEKRVYQGSSGKVYPLPFTDRIAETPVARKWQAVWIENEFLRVLVLPEIGGRIHTIQDKTNGYDLIYNQPVIKPALVGLAGPWASGGIEFNWPQHHRPATFLPVDFAIEKPSDGSQIIWCSDHDPMCRMKGMHGVCLHPGKAYVELKVRGYNRTPLRQTFLWWANVATRVHEAYQSFFPPDVHCVADHARRSMSEYPLAQGSYYGVNYGERGRRGIPVDEVPGQFIPPHCRPSVAAGTRVKELPNYAPNDLSFYANIPVPTSYMCIGSREDFFGGYDYRAQAGIVHIANHHISPGKKQWTWGNHEFGYAWDRNLTDADARGEFSPYIEIMSGVYTDNQPDFSFLQPGETKTWSQYWYPIQKIGPAQHANLDAAVSLALRKKDFSLGVAVTRAFSKAVVRLERADGSAAAEWNVNLAPGRPFLLGSPQAAKPWKVGETILRVLDGAGGEIISYEPKPRLPTAVPSPATEPAMPAAIASADELYLTGRHLDQYRHATRCPTLYWREALRRDPGDARCNNALGLWHLHRGEFAAAETHFRQTIERLTRRNANPDDGEAYYNLGLCLRHLDREAEAYAAFYKSVWNQAWMAAGYHALAEIDCRRQAWKTALDHLQRSLRFNTDNLRARNLKVLVLQKLNRTDDAAALLRETIALDSLDWWARHLNGERISCDNQTALDLAHDFARAGFFTDAIELLAGTGKQKTDGARAFRPGPSAGNDRFAPGRRPALRFMGRMGDPHPLPDQSCGALPLVHYTLGWLHEKAGDRQAALASYQVAAQQSPDYCFPARLEEIAILESALRSNPKDARAPYYLGNLLYDRRRPEEAIHLWERSAKLDCKFSIVWRNLGLAYFNIRHQTAKARAAYDRALQVNPDDARLLFERDQLWKRVGIKPAQRLHQLQKRLDLVRRRDDLSLELCALYNQTGQHAQALALVSSRNFQPWEGGEGGPLGQWARSHLALGRKAMESVAAGILPAVAPGFPPGGTSVGRLKRPGRMVASEMASVLSGRQNAAFSVRQKCLMPAASAVAHFEAALTAPPNLGEARHLLANHSDIHYWLGCAFAELGEKASARQHWLIAATFKGDFQEMSVRKFSELTYYSARAWEKLGQRAKAKKLFRDLLAYAQKLRRTEARIDYFATSLPTMLIFDDDLQYRQQTRALFLQAQAQLGLGRRAKARALLKAVLKRDPGHALAADLATEQTRPRP